MAWKSEEVRGAPLEVGGLRVTPVAKATAVRIGVPGFSVFRASVRPVSVEVDGPDGRRKVRIPDRQKQIAGMIQVVLALLALFMLLRNRRNS